MTNRNEKQRNNRYRSFDELPVTLTVADLQNVFGISRSAAYRLLHEPGFPTIRVGNALRVPKKLFLAWVQEKTTIMPSGEEGNDGDENAEDAPKAPLVQKAQSENPKIVGVGDSFSREGSVLL